MRVELLIDQSWSRIIKYGHYLFARDERTVVNGYSHTLYFIDLNYVSENVNYKLFKCEFDSENDYQLSFDLMNILRTNDYNSEVIENDAISEYIDINMPTKSLLQIICSFLDIDRYCYEIVYLKGYKKQHHDFEIHHGGTCIVIKDNKTTDIKRERIFNKHKELNVITNEVTLLSRYYDFKLQNTLHIDSDTLLAITERLRDHVNVHGHNNFIHIVSEDIYNNNINNINTYITLEDSRIHKYLCLYNENVYKITEASIIILNESGSLQDGIRLDEFINFYTI